MEYKVEMLYYPYSKKKIVTGILLKFDKIEVELRINKKTDLLEILVTKKEKYKRKRINLNEYLEAVVEYISTNQFFYKSDSSIFEEDILDLNKVRVIKLNSLKLEQSDIEYMRHKFKNLKYFYTEMCTIYNSCNIGVLGCNFRDIGSNISSLDVFNHFTGDILSFKKTHFRKMNKNFLHLNNVITTFEDVKVDYALFFLITDAPKMRKLEISKIPKLNDSDLIFISGLYNLEILEADGLVHSYDQLMKLERLKEMGGIYCIEQREYDKMKRIQKEGYEYMVGRNLSAEQLKNYLITQRFLLQTKYQKAMQRLYVDRLERVKWQDKIEANDLEHIRNHLLEIDNMSIKERREIGKVQEERDSIFDAIYGLDSGVNEDDSIIKKTTSGGPFDDDGIEYYTLDIKRYIKKLGEESRFIR